MPLEYLTLAYDMPFMLLLGDIRQGVFYATLLSFWLVFAGEHLMVRKSDYLKSDYLQFLYCHDCYISNKIYFFTFVSCTHLVLY